MDMKTERSLVAFEDQQIRRVYDEKSETWFFSVVDVVAGLTGSTNPRDYWFKMKTRVKAEDGFELSTICRQLKLISSDGKRYATDCSDVQGLFRIIQSIPSPKAEPFKQWLAKVGYERIQDMSDPARSLDRAREFWKQHGRSEKWIQQRMMGQETRNKLTERMNKEGGQLVTNFNRLKTGAFLFRLKWLSFYDFCAFLWLKIYRIPAFQ
jgi:prophage antirepressor-like protein